MALFRRFFYRKPPDRLLEISDRVYVFDCCFSSDVLDEDDYKEYLGGIVAQLHEYFPDSSFMVFNFGEGDQSSKISDILSHYDMTVMEYPRQFENCPLLPLEMINHFLHSSERWLSLEGQQYILLMHCERGGWPTLAFMLACLLLYKRQYSGEQKTLETVYKQAPKELLQLLSPLDTQSSHIRYLQYISRLNLHSQWSPTGTPVVVDSLILRILPLFDGGKGCRPIVRLYGQDPSTKASRNTKQLFPSSKTKKRVQHYSEAECVLVKLDIHCHVQGDVVLECVHLCEDRVQERMMFRVMFNTSFIRSHVLMLGREDIDVLWDAKDKFPKGFKAEILFSDVESDDDNQTSALPEVYFEGKQIFSNDGQDSKSDFYAQMVREQSEDDRNRKEIWKEQVVLNGFQDHPQYVRAHNRREAKAQMRLEEVKDIGLDVESDSNTVKDILIDHIDAVKDIALCSEEKMAESVNVVEDTLIKQDMGVEKRVECDSPTKNLTGEVGKLKLDKFHERFPRKPPTFNQKPSSYSAGNMEKGGKQKPAEHRWIPSNKGSYTNSMHLSYPAIRVIKSSPSLIGSPKSQVKEGSAFGKPRNSADNLYVGANIEHSTKSYDFNQLLHRTPNKSSLAAHILHCIGESETKAITAAAGPPTPPRVAPPKFKPPTVNNAMPRSPSLPPSFVTNFHGSSTPPPPPPPPQLSPQTSRPPPKPDSLFPFVSLVEVGVIYRALHPPSPPSPPPPAHVKRVIPSQPHPLDVIRSQLISRASSPHQLVPLPASPQPPLSSEKAMPATQGALQPPSKEGAPPIPFNPDAPPSTSLAYDTPPSAPSSLQDVSSPSPSVPQPYESQPPAPPPQTHGNLPSSTPLPHGSPLTLAYGFPQSPLLPLMKIALLRPLPPSPPSSTPLANAATDAQLPSSMLGAPPPSTVPLSPMPEASPSSHPSSSLSAGALPPSHASAKGVQSPPPPPPPPLAYGSPAPPPLSLAQAPPPPPPTPLEGAPPPPPSPGDGGPPPPLPTTSRGLSQQIPSVSSGAPPPPPPAPPGLPGGAPPPSPPPPMSGGAPPPPAPPGRPGGGPPPPPPPMSGGPPPGGAIPGPPAPPQAPGGGPVPPPPLGSKGPNAPSAPPAMGRGRGLQRSAAITARKTALKPLHWSKVTRVVKGSLWEELQKHTGSQMAADLDVKEIEILFSNQPKTAVAGNAGADKKKAAGSKSDVVHVMDLKRVLNTEIMLTKIKMPLPDMMAAALALNESVLDAEMVENLIKFCPTKEEMEILKNYTGDKEKLGKCEQFFMELMKVPRVESKLQVFLFKIQYNTQLADFRTSLHTVNAACEEVRNCEKLKEIMKLVLTLGNFLNQGTARGAAVGFKLESLLKLTDTRASNSRMTLMHYLCKHLAKTATLLDFHEDLKSLEAAAKIQLKALAEEMQAITKGLEKVKQEFNASENDGPVSEGFRKTLKGFNGAAEAEVASVMSLYTVVGRNADALVVYVGEDPARCPFEQVMQTLLSFIGLFRKSHEDNLKQAEIDKKKAEKEAELEKAKAEKEAELEKAKVATSENSETQLKTKLPK